ncbi:MAG: GNAT family N-acetyltransferase, partial [Phycisphaeraceae bacterium]|nr:GNAT family N-acetyltransferase [Phycisphaeraceae bacterium]
MFQLTLKNGSTVAYRRLRAGDDLQLQTFNRNLAQLSREFFSPHAYDDQTVAKIIARAEKEEDRTYIVLDGEKIVAYFFLWWYQTRFPVLGIGIADEYQGLGMGSQLMAILIEDGKKSGCDAIELTTMLKNKKAFSVYEKVGFQCL